MAPPNPGPMSDDRLRAGLRDGEALRFEVTTRGGNAVGLTDRRLLIARDEELVGVDLEAVEEVTVQSFDWFLALLSLGLVAFGLLSAERNLLVAGAFVLAGVGSLALTVRKRGRVKVMPEGRATPLVFHLSDTDSFETAFERRVGEYEERFFDDDPSEETAGRE